MPAIQQLYLRLCLVQGLCLALGFWGCLQLQNRTTKLEPLSQQFEASDAGRIRETRAASRAAIVSFLGTWSLLAGGTGLLLLREQRRQISEVLERHSEPQTIDPEVNVISRRVANTLDAIVPATIVQPVVRLRIASHNDEISGHRDVEDHTDEPVCVTLSLVR